MTLHDLLAANPVFRGWPEDAIARVLDGSRQSHWQADTLAPPRLLPEREWPFVIPESPPEPDFLDHFKVTPVKRVLLRPIGVPWFLPGELGTSKNGDLPGPGIGLDLSWTPTKNWRFGADLVVRAERVDADNRLHENKAAPHADIAIAG